MIEHHVFPNTTNWQIADDMTVYSSDGEKLGKVRNYDPSAGYLDVQKGWLFKQDFYVPLSAVDTVDQESVTLKLSQFGLEDGSYSSPPTAAATPEPVGRSSHPRWTDSDDVRQRSLDEDDTVYTEEAREEWATRPR